MATAQACSRSLVGCRALLPRLSGRGDRSASWPIRRHQRKPEKYGVSAWTVGQTVLGCPQVLGILTTDPLANRTPMASQAVAGLFRYWGPAAQTRTSGLPRVEQGPSPSDLCGDPTVPDAREEAP